MYRWFILKLIRINRRNASHVSLRIPFSDGQRLNIRAIDAYEILGHRAWPSPIIIFTICSSLKASSALIPREGIGHFAYMDFLLLEVNVNSFWIHGERGGSRSARRGKMSYSYLVEGGHGKRQTRESRSTRIRSLTGTGRDSPASTNDDFGKAWLKHFSKAGTTASTLIIGF